jgi:hypothetical protein
MDRLSDSATVLLPERFSQSGKYKYLEVYKREFRRKPT